MRRGAFNLAVAVSLLLCVGSAALCALSYVEGVDQRTYLPLVGAARASLYGGRLWFYNTALPYNGGVVGIGLSDSPPAHSWSFDWPVYFRQIRLRSGPIWVLTVPLHLFAAVMSLMPLVWLVHVRRPRRTCRITVCLVCGYDIRATPTRCPECGTPTTAGVKA